MTDEVPVAGGIPGGYDGETARHIAEGELFLLVHQALLRQALYGLPAPELRRPEREARLDVVDAEAQAVELAVAHHHPQQDFHPPAYPVARRILESLRKRKVAAAPDDGLGTGDHTAPVATAQVHIAVAVGLDLHGRDFRTHPEPFGEEFFDASPHLPLQFKQINPVSFHPLQK